ncbi:hypothetical protein PGTUg99_008902 [Puccinia graminis f. sp. tritici]|uniref:Uncharacterized protein n=1 Tax=Puccinia graminis f. sp. tritici TaxID=56615 RepID=A0A5B0PFU1_PUCGR|nr:hypothetical protein PGTUg99_008902 [Puccinia graminis f. sp. tritici]
MPSLVTLLLVLLSLTLGLQAQAPGYRPNWEGETTRPGPSHEPPPTPRGSNAHDGDGPIH